MLDLEIKPETAETYNFAPSPIPTSAIDPEKRELLISDFLDKRINNYNLPRRVLYGIGRFKLHTLGTNGSDAMSYAAIHVLTRPHEVRRTGAKTVLYAGIGMLCVGLVAPHTVLHNKTFPIGEPDKTCQLGPRTLEHKAVSGDSWSSMLPKIPGIMGSGMCYQDGLNLMYREYGDGPKRGDTYYLPSNAKEVIVTPSTTSQTTVTTIQPMSKPQS